jgi:hypothetical protein
MTFKPNEPMTQEVPVQSMQERALDTYHLHEIRITHNPGGTDKVQIMWSAGYMDGEEYVVAYSRKTVVSEEVLAKVIAAKVGANNTVYQQIRNSCWNMLRAMGVVPEGKIG